MQTRRERVVDANAEQKIAIRCKVTARLNARADSEGIYMFCRQCNTQHLLSWEDLEKLKNDIQNGTVSKTIYI